MVKEVMVKEWVIGFLFQKDCTEVALILKNHPDWHKNRLNGPGGHVERWEDTMLAMFREFKEETGCGDYDWRRFCSLDWPEGTVHFFTARVSEAVLTCTTDEPVAWFKVDQVLQDPRLIPNLRWLIPMALDSAHVVANVTDCSALLRQYEKRLLEIRREKLHKLNQG